MRISIIVPFRTEENKWKEFSERRIRLISPGINEIEDYDWSWVSLHPQAKKFQIIRKVMQLHWSGD